MGKTFSLRFRKSSLIGVLIIYYMLIDSSFPFAEAGLLLNFFYWTKYIVAIVVILYATFCIHKRESALYIRCKRLSRLYFMPWVLMLLYSCIIWLTQGTSKPYITRGISNFIANVIPILLGASLFMIYKKKTVKLVIVAICMMALTNYTMGIVVNGPTFLLQLFNINCEESTFRVYKELHEIAYIAGLLLLYYFDNKNDKLNYSWLFCVLLIFFFAWKRIGIFALVVALMLYTLLEHIDQRGKRFIILACGIVGFIFSILYVWISASDELSLLLHKYGINMMGRDVLYSYFRKFCTFSIFYLGRGIGFVSRQFNYLTWEDVGAMIALKQGLHNDLFSLYLEIGMIGFIVWTIYQVIYIPRKICEWSGINSAIRSLTFIIFTFITYTTDNTLRYFAYQMTLVILITATSYEKCRIKYIIEKKYSNNSEPERSVN